MAAARNWNWVWFFVVMFSLATIMAGSNFLYNRQQQLRPEQIEEAIRKWESHGPANYDLTVKKDVLGLGGSISDLIRVKVRAGKAIEVTLNDRPLDKRLWPEYEMPGILDWISRFAEIDSKPEADRVFCVGRFDPTDGHLKGYVRSVRARQERQDLKIELKRVAP